MLVIIKTDPKIKNELNTHFTYVFVVILHSSLVSILIYFKCQFISKLMNSMKTTQLINSVVCKAAMYNRYYTQSHTQSLFFP
jgi:hypothetical protein